MKAEWTIEWARKPTAGRYTILDCTPPSLTGSHAFRILDQCILGIVTQARTGYGHFGEYYQTHNIQEPINCLCGAGLQTHEHIAFECQTHKEYGNIIDEGAPDHQLTTLLAQRQASMPLCGKSYQCPVLGTRFGSTGTWYPPGPSAGEHHLPLVLVYHHGRQWVTSLLFFVVHTQINSGK